MFKKNGIEQVNVVIAQFERIAAALNAGGEACQARVLELDAQIQQLEAESAAHSVAKHKAFLVASKIEEFLK